MIFKIHIQRFKKPLHANIGFSYFYNKPSQYILKAVFWLLQISTHLVHGLTYKKRSLLKVINQSRKKRII